MSRIEADRIFRPKPSAAETKMDHTTAAAHAIIDAEAAARKRKTARLQSARLEQKAAEDAKPPQRKAKRAKK